MLALSVQPKTAREVELETQCDIEFEKLCNKENGLSFAYSELEFNIRKRCWKFAFQKLFNNNCFGLDLKKYLFKFIDEQAWEVKNVPCEECSTENK